MYRKCLGSEYGSTKFASRSSPIHIRSMDSCKLCTCAVPDKKEPLDTVQLETKIQGRARADTKSRSGFRVKPGMTGCEARSLSPGHPGRSESANGDPGSTRRFRLLTFAQYLGAFDRESGSSLRSVKPDGNTPKKADPTGVFAG
jgi:hypothetical protein